MSDFINGATGLPWDAKKRKNKKNKIMQNIDLPFYIYIQQLITKRYKWEGLPKTIKPFILEQMLFYYGQVVVFKYGGNIFALPCVNVGEKSGDGDIQLVRPISFNPSTPMGGTEIGMEVCVTTMYDEYGNVVREQDGVLIRNNDLRLSTIWFIDPFLEQIKYTIESNNIAQMVSRIKWVISGDKDSVKALEDQLDKAFSSSKPYALVRQKFGEYGDKAMTDVSGESNMSYNPEPYWYNIDKTLNFLMTMLGINNNLETKKKARLNVAEVESNNELVYDSDDIWLRPRQDACDELREVLGLNVTCEPVYQEDDGVDEQDNKDNNQGVEEDTII